MPRPSTPWQRAQLAANSPAPGRTDTTGGPDGGANRVDEGKISDLISEPVEKADADYVREKTGFSIGGVPPVGHAERPVTFVDEDLLREEEIWASAGHTHAVFKLDPTELLEMTGGLVVAVK